jgi:superfamily II DNA or RNA helicase
MLLRKHQNDFADTIDRIIDGSPIKKILVHVVPGGGKSAIPLLAGKLITAGLVDKLCWVCPRKSLQDQAERNFVDPFFRNMLEHTLTIRSSTNEPNPCRGLAGFVTTYQAIGVDDKRTVLRDFQTKRYVLVLDENHHVEKEGEWYKALDPIVNNAAFLILMTGTLSRGDDKPIAWVRYWDGLPVVAPDATTAVIRYTREDALRERAILPIEFTLADGHVEWEKDGVRKSGRLSGRIEDAGQALFAALSTEFSDSLLDKAVSHWQAHKATHPSSKLLIVTADFDHAKKVTARLKGQGINVKIATSHDSPQAQKNIKEFKYGGLPVLISIQMAYEGLDCPPISHIAALTRIRTTPWIEQMISRAVRIDPQAGPYETQRAYVFAPDDFLFRTVVDRIKAEQLAYVKEAQDREQKERARNGEGSRRPPDVIPLGSTLTGERSFSIGDISPIDMHPQTPTDMEQTLRKQIDDYVKEYAFKNYYRIERINGEIKAAFGKPRSEMSLSELRSTLSFIRDAYPLNGQSLVSVVSQPRGRGRRTRAKAEEVEAPKQMGLWG